MASGNEISSWTRASDVRYPENPLRTVSGADYCRGMILAGTSRGVFELTSCSSHAVLAAKGVRELVVIGKRLFAGTSTGIWCSDDEGATWEGPALADRKVWVIRGAADGALFAGVEPVGLFRSADHGAVVARSRVVFRRFPRS